MATAPPNRKACDRCHDLKLACRRTSEGQCERCLKANRSCTSSPSLRHRKKRSCGRREPRNRGKPLQIRPGPLKATGETLFPPHRSRLLCNSVSQSEQAFAAPSNPFDEPQVNKNMISLSSPHNARPSFPSLQGEEYKSYKTRPPSFMNYECFRQTPIEAEVGPRYLELRPPHSGLNCNEFQDTMAPEYFKETLPGYLSEVNWVHDAWKTLQADTTCSGTSAVCSGLDETHLPRLSIEDVFHLSQRFAFSLNTMANSSMLGSGQVDLTVASSVYSMLRDIHDIIIQLTAQSLQQSRDAVVRITNWHRLHT
ncbi:hypothetical protein CIB48_g7551 [Xylaria polymorpha]|nr:hypothetical protein CIB48_g7551 [Xylaria polymorpha]